MTRIPIDLDAPIACTATADEIPDRIDQIGLLRERLGSIDRTSTGVVLRFEPDPTTVAHLERFVRDEKACCRFWGFSLEADGDHVTLHWDGPPDVQPFLDELDAWFRSDQPLDALRGLL